MADDCFHGSALGEQMAGAWDNFHFLGSLETGKCLLVQFDDARVIAADDQKRRGTDLVERRAREVRPPAARDDRADAIAELSCCDQGGRSASARAEQADPMIADRLVRATPVHGLAETPCQKRNVEDIGPVRLLGRGQQIEQQRRHAATIQGVRDRDVSQTEPA
jgi:hypothetical protein